MNGIVSKFYCPSCHFSGITSLGITKHVFIKNDPEKLAVDRCPACGKPIAFKTTRVSEHSNYIIGGNRNAICLIFDTIQENINNNIRDEEIIKKTVLKTMSERFNQKYVEDNYIEIVQLFELKISEVTAPLHIKAYDLSLLSDEDISSAGFVFY